MAEFQEVMKILKRQYENMGLYDFDYAKMEEDALKWAAEHPEPVYPTWGEWLQEIGVAEVGSGMLSIHPAIAEQHIPASFAQEHGIEPKEGA